MCEIVSRAFTQLHDATRLVMRLARFVFFLQSIKAAVIREQQRISKPGSLKWAGANTRAKIDTKRISLPWLNLIFLYVICRPPVLVGADTLFDLQENRLKRSCCPDNLFGDMSSIAVNVATGKGNPQCFGAASYCPSGVFGILMEA